LSKCKSSPSSTTTTATTSSTTTINPTTTTPLSAGFDYYANCDTYLASITIRNCVLGQGTDCNIANNDYSSFSKPKKDITGICRNLVKSVTYLLQYKNPDGILEAKVDIEFFDSDFKDTANVEQTFQTVYVPSSENIVSAIGYLH